MPFAYTRHHLTGKEKTLQRFFEILPGLTSWSIVIVLTILSVTRPVVAAVVIIAFELYWFLKIVYMTIFLILSYCVLRIEESADWLSRIKDIDALGGTLQKATPLKSAGNIFAGKRERFSFEIHKNNLLKLKICQDPPPPSECIRHLVIIPVAKEPRGIVEPGLESLSRQSFSPKRILVVLALEQRATEEIKNDILSLEKKYKEYFLDLLTIIHPSDLPNEAKVKGANVTTAARQAAEYLQNKKIPMEHVVVSCFDADTIVGKDYIASLTYYYLVTEGRTRTSFQPIPVYHNNIWDVPGFARVMESGSSFFQLIEATNPEKLVTFSSHSMSFKALVDVGYWPVDMISDDSAIFWKCFLFYQGDYRVVPMHVTLSMDIAASDTWWRSAQSVYKQKRRWAWGVENFPILMRGFLRSPGIPPYDKIRLAFKMFEGHVSWASWGFLLTVVSWLPIFFAGREFQRSVVYYNVPEISRTIFNLAFLSLFTSAILSIALLPKARSKRRLLIKIGHAFEWLAIPFIMVFLSGLPALDAQTRLMFGRYMEFWVTDKKRKA